MKGKFVRSIAVLAAGTMLAVGTAHMAAAAPAGGHGTSSTQAVAARVLQLRDDLTKVAYAGDVNATKSRLDELNPVLSELATGKRYQIQAEAQDTAGKAELYGTETKRLLNDPKATPRQLPPVPAIPPIKIPDLPGPLKIVSDLLNALLNLVTGLLASLVGGGVPSLPVPVPPVPKP
ncbi:hypothetical protein [Amycolatopsis sp. NPDC059021]|uniref:hypothetical protein n=1 Tax=Amycolatopsis sp. NPDC059021 TaxID=3346704 RepID=UPI00366FF697